MIEGEVLHGQSRKSIRFSKARPAERQEQAEEGCEEARGSEARDRHRRLLPSGRQQRRLLAALVRSTLSFDHGSSGVTSNAIQGSQPRPSWRRTCLSTLPAVPPSTWIVTGLLASSLGATRGKPSGSSRARSTSARGTSATEREREAPARFGISPTDPAATRKAAISSR